VVLIWNIYVAVRRNNQKILDVSLEGGSFMKWLLFKMHLVMYSVSGVLAEQAYNVIRVLDKLDPHYCDKQWGKRMK